MVGSLQRKRSVNSRADAILFSYADKSSVMPESTDSEEEAASNASDGDEDGDKKPAAADPSVSLFVTASRSMFDS